MKICQKCNSSFDDSVRFCPRDGEVLVKDHSSMVGRTLDGQYEIEGFIAAGGMGAVYKARHILLGDRVAIKLLSPEMSGNAEWLKRFQREGQVARKFRHPNAVVVHDLRTSSDGLIYMVMEFVEGHTLDVELKNRGRFSPMDALTVLEPIASVLDAAHSMGVVHRDLKPENIMLGNSGNGELGIKLLDLGIAKMREMADPVMGGGTALTVAGQVLGTPYYMSPEQWGELPRDGGHEIDNRADIYSFGIIVYELTTGYKPFSGQTIQELRQRHLSATPLPIHELLPDVPESFGKAVARAMSKDRADRQSTAGELINDLRASLGLPLLSTSGGLRASQNFSTSSQVNQTNQPGQRTANIPENRSTNAGSINPTVMVSDPGAGKTSGQTNAKVSSSGEIFPTVATIPSASVSTPTDTKPTANKRTSLFVAVAIGLLALLGGGSLLAWFIYNRIKNGSSDIIVTNPTPIVKPSPANSPPPPLPKNVDVLRYWVSVDRSKEIGKIEQRADTNVQLPSSNSFKFCIEPIKDGYIYIIGPGKDDLPSLFLGDKGLPDAGVKTNKVQAAKLFKFPAKDDAWLTLDKDSTDNTFTIVYSTKPIESLSFLNKNPIYLLKSEENEALKSFLKEHKANNPASAVKSASQSGPIMMVSKLEQPQTEDSPVIFDINLEAAK
jgi:eukaryotic-like serine/threonine-protein kinase